MGFLGRSLLRARRVQTTIPWVGVRANLGVDRGRVAFSVLNECGGNIRVGWSTAAAKLDLGKCKQSFGFGGTGTKSHAGRFHSWGQSYGKGDTVTALLDLERHALRYMVNDHLIPGNAFALPKNLWQCVWYPHVLTKEATFEIYFGPAQGAPPQAIKPPQLPLGFVWIGEVAYVPNPTQPNPGRSVQFIDDAEAQVKEQEALAKMMEATHGNQAVHRDQFAEWKVRVTEYVRHFQPAIADEYAANREQVMQRVRTHTLAQLQRTGEGCHGLQARLELTASTMATVYLWPADGSAVPSLSEISVGRVVLITSQEQVPNMAAARVTISGDVDRISNQGLQVSTRTGVGLRVQSRLFTARRGRPLEAL